MHIVVRLIGLLFGKGKRTAVECADNNRLVLRIGDERIAGFLRCARVGEPECLAIRAELRRVVQNCVRVNTYRF